MENRIFVFIGLLILSCVGFYIWNNSQVTSISQCKVIELQNQQLINGSGKSVSTEIRYLIITDKETFVCESSLINRKFNNSDIFWRLKKDSTYSFKVSGIGKTFITDYRNILEYW